MKKNLVLKNLAGMLLMLLLSAVAWPAAAKVKLPAFFSDNMVLQQKEDVPIWGAAEPGKSIQVVTSWNKKKHAAKADAKGNWKLTVATPAAGGPYAITFNDGEELVLNNILIGEVWICSGQSNMEMPLAGWGQIKDSKKEIAAANYPNIRLLQVRKNTSTVPLTDVEVDGGSWQECSPQTVAEFSAVAYFFARDIHQNQNIPIGLIHTSWGGTVAEAWTSGESLKKMSAFQPAVEKMERGPHDEQGLRKQYTELLAKRQQEFIEKDAGYKNGQAQWVDAGLATAGWKKMDAPGYWEEGELANFDGVIWLRKEISLPKAWAGQEIKLHLGSIDDNDITWFNGKEVGRTDGWNAPRAYTVPKNIAKAGKNVVAVRALDTGGNGGLHGEAAGMYLSNAAGDVIPLAGEWQYKIGIDVRNLPPMPANVDDPNRATVLYNAMIHPLVPFAIRGAIWYQGESNAGRAYQYRELFPLMISDWRQKWGKGDFPFYFVQLANFMEAKAQPAASDWAELREAQLMTLKLPNTGMAVAIDVGEAADIHPKNKQDVGKRLALIARAQVYGEKIPFSGPVYASSKITGNKVRLSFRHTDDGLQARDKQELKGFAVAGADKKFHWAEAKIVGNEIEVSSPEVPNPVAVRYGWANNPEANLYNGAGLPATPFRTDQWAGITAANQ